MVKHYIGIDNGVTGSIGMIRTQGGITDSVFIETPVFKELSYTKKKQYIHRIDTVQLTLILPKPNESFILLERPMINNHGFVASQSAIRALEATLVVIERLGYKRWESYDYIDSKTWQKKFIASSIIGHDALKEASKKIGIELFPLHTKPIEKHGDADGLLIAEYLYRYHLQNR